jgi:hypothetical protein
MRYKWIFSLALSVVMFSANAQFRKIPAQVTDSFRTRFNDATKVSWRDNITSFQATFKKENDNVKASFTSKGEWLKTEKYLTLDKAPEEVKDGFKKSKYADWTIKEVVSAEEKDKQPLYRILIRKSDLQKKNLYFSTFGQLLEEAITL